MKMSVTYKIYKALKAIGLFIWDIKWIILIGISIFVLTKIDEIL